MGMARRIRQEGQSQLDYLWVNYGDFATSSVPTDDPDTIITQGAIKSLLQEFKGVASVEVIDKEGTKILQVKTSENEIFEYPFPTNITIVSFRRREITQADRNKGCELPLGTLAYSILMSDGNEYLAPITKYTGSISPSIAVDLLESAIYAELKVSNRPSIISLGVYEDGVSADLNFSSEIGGIAFEKKEDGLYGNVVLQNSDKFIKFSLLTSEEYSDLAEANLVDDTTMYFIKGSKIFYFGTYKMSGSSGSVDLDDYYSKQEIDRKLKDYVTKDELQTKLDSVIINWINT